MIGKLHTPKADFQITVSENGHGARFGISKDGNIITTEVTVENLESIIKLATVAIANLKEQDKK